MHGIGRVGNSDIQKESREVDSGASSLVSVANKAGVVTRHLAYDLETFPLFEVEIIGAGPAQIEYASNLCRVYALALKASSGASMACQAGDEGPCDARE